MSEPGHNLTAGEQQLRSFVDRILRLKEEQDNLGADVRDVYAEAKAQGYDKTALGALVSELRKKAKDSGKFEEAQSILDLYREAYARSLTHTHAPARPA